MWKKKLQHSIIIWQRKVRKRSSTPHKLLKKYCCNFFSHLLLTALFSSTVNQNQNLILWKKWWGGCEGKKCLSFLSWNVVWAQICTAWSSDRGWTCCHPGSPRYYIDRQHPQAAVTTIMLQKGRCGQKTRLNPQSIMPNAHVEDGMSTMSTCADCCPAWGARNIPCSHRLWPTLDGARLVLPCGQFSPWG